MLVVKYKTIFYQFYCGHEPTWVRNIVSCAPGDWLQVKNTVAKPDRHLVMQMQIFLCVLPYQESISKKINNDNDLNLQSMTKLSSWLCCYMYIILVLSH